MPPPGLASFQDLYTALLAQYEAVSFGDRLFGSWVLLPLQRRYSATMRLAVFGEHVAMLRSLGVTLEQVNSVLAFLKCKYEGRFPVWFPPLARLILLSVSSTEAVHPDREVHLPARRLPPSPSSLFPLLGNRDPEVLLVSHLVCGRLGSCELIHLLTGCCSTGTARLTYVLPVQRKA